MSRRPVTIGLLWHSVNSPNLGLGALTLGHLAILDEIAAAQDLAPRYIVIGAGDAAPAYIARDDLSVVALRLRDFVKPSGGLAGATRACDLVLDIGGGDSFTDIYGAKRFRMLLATKLMALALGRPLVLAPQTIGPFDRAWTRRLAVGVMNRARLVATRDALSTRYLADIGYRGTPIEASDVALRLSYAPPEPRPPDAPQRIGLNVSGLLFNGGYTGANQFGLAVDYPALIREICARITADRDRELHLIGHVLGRQGAVDDDYGVAAALAEAYPDAVLAPRFPDPGAAKRYIAGMDLFLGARMHACIAAFSAGIPVLPMAYSRKFAGLFASLGYDLVADCRAEGEEAILAKLDQAWDRRSDLATAARAGTARGLERLEGYAEALAPALVEAASGRRAGIAAGRARA